MAASQLRLLAMLGVVAASAAISIPARGEPAAHGIFTEQQARAGARDYAAYCVTCHGADLHGPQIPLAGPSFVSLGRDTGMTLGQFFDFVVRDTPAGSISSLSHEQYVEIMAYIMQQNGYATGPRPLLFQQALDLKDRIAAQPSRRAN